MPVNHTDSWSDTGLLKRLPMEREPTVISFNRGNGRVARAHPKQWPCSKRECGHRSQLRVHRAHVWYSPERQGENVTGRGSCNVELAQWKGINAPVGESQSKEKF